MTTLWSSTPGTYVAGQSEITEADLAALTAERKWGAGRLRLLVDPDLRARFDSQRLKLDAAIREGQLEDVRRESRRMVAAWRALDKAATAAGKDNTPPACWEVALSDGTVAVIVRDDEAASLVQHEGRQVAVYTLGEIGRILSARMGSVTAAKLIFPGATVRAVKTPLDPLNDDLVF